MLCRIAYTRGCTEQLFDMGSGSRSLCELGINKKNAYERCAGLCRIIVALGERFGHQVSIEVSHLVCAVCEAHRRGVFSTDRIVHRPGLG